MISCMILRYKMVNGQILKMLQLSIENGRNFQFVDTKVFKVGRDFLKQSIMGQTVIQSFSNSSTQEAKKRIQSAFTTTTLMPLIQQTKHTLTIFKIRQNIPIHQSLDLMKEQLSAQAKKTALNGSSWKGKCLKSMNAMLRDWLTSFSNLMVWESNW